MFNATPTIVCMVVIMTGLSPAVECTDDANFAYCNKSSLADQTPHSKLVHETTIANSIKQSAFNIH